MMLQFTQAGSAWACEFEVTDKINLHIENAEGILLYQRTAAGKFALIKDAPTSTGPVFDYDLEGLVYPKHIRVICSSLPTYAEVVSDGEITEIKSQTKEVEITANGTTQVAPDAGYSYLTGVTVKTNVPQSGGSGGSGGNIEYLDIRQYIADIINNQYIAAVLGGAVSIKIIYNGMQFVGPVYFMLSILNDIQAVVTNTIQVAIDWSAKTVIAGETNTVLGMALLKATQEQLNAIPRITEEEFYTI